MGLRKQAGSGLAAGMAGMVVVVCLAGMPPAAGGADARFSNDQLQFFNDYVRPVLKENCYDCHSHEAKKSKGGLVVDSRQGLLAGGESGPALIPGKPEESLLIRAVRYHDEDLQMPPDGRLDESTIDALARWIEMGAPDDRTPVAATGAAETNPAKHWAFQPVGHPAPPPVNDDSWARSEIDGFILARLEREGLEPVEDAGPHALLRRVYFDLVGLPPAPRAIEEFAADPSKERFRRIVDELLASPAFGERWGRHWLDVARYAESNGKDRDVLNPFAWKYRDYVVDAFNSDLPFNRFIIEQIAGDLLPADEVGQRDRQRIGSGFLALGAKSLSQNARQLEMDLIDEQLDTIGRAFLGLSLGCARCHDHKFDPVSARDYYSLAGIFLSTDTRFGRSIRNRNKQPDHELHLVLGPGAEEKIKAVESRGKQLAKLEKQRDAAAKKVKALEKKLPKDWKKRRQLLAKIDKVDALEDPGDRKVFEYLEGEEKLKQLQASVKEVEASPEPELTYAMGVTEAKKARDCKVHVRGELKNLGDEAPRGFPKFFEFADEMSIPEDRSGRLELARWITHPENPLTARVAVNRIWLRLFGRGLVDSVDNFGINGESPSHPELLDYLARRFMDRGWSVKRTIREIVLSRTYRLSAEPAEQGIEKDPAGVLRWRMNRRRLEAEAIRDALLVAGGRLKLERPEASPVAEIGHGEVGRGINTKPLAEPYPYRSVYLPIIRTIIPEVLKTFDFPEPSNVQGKRDSATLPAQALYFMNSPFVSEQARGMAERVTKAESSLEARIRLAYLIACSRPPTESETARCLEFLKNAERGREWMLLCQALMAGAEFRFVN